MRSHSIKHIFFAGLLALPLSVYSSDYGTLGLIDVPTARMQSDGMIKTTVAIESISNSYAITYQATPWLETTFRYTGYNHFFFYDRNYEAKLKLWSERDFLPQVAIGVRDLFGTGYVGSEYVVASKMIGSWDFTAGLAWGRLAGDGNFKNPFRFLSNSFTERDKDVGLGGRLANKTFFRGEKVGLFGGVSYQFDTLPLSFMLEYNQDQYYSEVAGGAPKPKSPLSGSIKWDIRPGVSVAISRQHNQDWGIGLAATLGTKSLPKKPSLPMYVSSLDLAPEQLPLGINQSSWYDMLLFDAERSGLLLLEASIDDSRNNATIVMGNMTYPLWIDAVDLMANLADLHLPSTVSLFNIVVEEEGHRMNSIEMRRPSLNYGRNKHLVEHEISIEPVRPSMFIQHKTDFVQKKIILDLNLSNRVQLFDPDDPARYQLYLKIGMSLMLPQNWVVSGTIDQDISNNFDESERESDSVIQRVRSDVVKYLVEGDSGLDSLYVQKRGNVKSDLLYRVYGGILESMYSGVGGEILYQPFQSRLAFGMSINWVRQRDFDKKFNHLNYQTVTALASAYWATPFYNFDVAVHFGRYLARDVGTTLEIRRTFNNGWMIGLWATKTDVSAEQFGEGSFDKGLFFKIPFNGFFGKNSRSSYTTRIRPVQRDGGQFLEDFSGNIWWDIRAARYDAFSESLDRLFE